jgi:virginiamycin B lyase
MEANGGVMLKHALLPLAAAALFATAGPTAGQTFPDGPGKDVLEKKCSTCHAPEQVTTFGRSAEEWHEVVVNMIDLGAEVNEEEAKVLVEYLAKNWPVKGSTPPADKPADKPAEQPAPKAAASAVTAVASHGPSVNIREWDVPTPNSRPHDPEAAADGSIWYTGQRANVLGRLDPKTGQIKEFALKTPDSGPHGLAEDKAGNIWYTGNSKALIGKLDPKTGQVTEYPMPDPVAKDPHSLIFDQKGMLWFTVQGANMVGRLNPATGELALRNSPTTRSLPNGNMVKTKGCLL